MPMQTSNIRPIRVKRPYVAHVDEFREDCLRIQSVLQDHGYYATLEQCAELWEINSENYAAGWLILPQDGLAIYDEVKAYFEAL